MNNSSASESTEISHEASNTQHTLGGATSERNHDQRVQDIENQNMQGIETCDCVESMYTAAIEGDWAKAEKLLEQDPTLTYKERNCYIHKIETGRNGYILCDKETGRKWYRPLHVAVALKHDKFALKLIQRMKPSDLVLTDSNYLTACGYAAAYGKLNIVKAMIRKHPDVLEECENRESLTSLAILSRKSKVVSFFLEKTREVYPLQQAAWLKILQTAVGAKMYGVALEILEKYGSLATISNENGTALHMLARQDISAAGSEKPAIIFRSIFGTTLKEIKTMAMPLVWKIYNKLNNKDVNIYDSGRQGEGEMPKDFRSLAKKLLEEIQKLKDKRAEFALLDDPPILHDAAKVGNVDLIRMITRAYPDLIWQIDRKTKRSLLDIVIESREANVFSFIQRFVALDIFCFFTEDEDKNNLLHLAAKLGPRKNTIPALQMQSELAWYKAVEVMLPPQAIEQKNKNEQKPRELFVKEHEELLKESKVWMKSTADSCMLIATIILTVVYASVFTVPGGNNGATGLPIFMKRKLLTCFFICEALALFSSTFCIITFWSITCSGFVEDQFLHILPCQLRLGFTALFGSLIGAISAFLAAYHLVMVEEKAWFVKSCLLSIYLILVLAICGRFSELWNKTKLPERLPQVLSKGNREGGLYSQRGRVDHDQDKSDQSKTDENENNSHPDHAKAK